MYKIISVDNFGRDDISDCLIAENIMNELEGIVMVNALNDRFSGDQASDFYKLVPADYQLYVFEGY